MTAINPRSIKADAEGPWLPFTSERRTELAHRLATTELPAEVLAQARVRGPILARAARSGIVAWVEEKSDGRGTDWDQSTMWRYRAILRHLGPPQSTGRREAGRANLHSVAATGGLALVGAGAVAAGPVMAATGAGAVVVITLAARVLRYVNSDGSIGVVVVLELVSVEQLTERRPALELVAA